MLYPVIELHTFLSLNRFSYCVSDEPATAWWCWWCWDARFNIEMLYASERNASMKAKQNLLLIHGIVWAALCKSFPCALLCCWTLYNLEVSSFFSRHHLVFLYVFFFFFCCCPARCFRRKSFIQSLRTLTHSDAQRSREAFLKCMQLSTKMW